MSATGLSVFGFRERLAQFLGYSHKGNRDLYETFGFPRYIRSEDLYAQYTRNPIAFRIIRAFSRATWEEMPAFFDEAGESEDDSEFIAAVGSFCRDFQLQRVMERTDRLASIGRFGLLVFGFQDGQRLDKPLKEGQHKLLYLQPYSEYNVTVNQFDTDETSPRFGLPVTYTVQQGSSTEQKQAPARPMNVHWTRALHISEFLDTDEVYGTPRLLPVYNDLKNLEKVMGGSAETFWLNANRGVAFWADKDAELSADEIQTIKDQADEFMHELRRHVVGQGMQAQVLGSDVADPGPNVDKLLDVIAGGAGIPKRILIGSERGELSSSQDVSAWSSQIEERRNTFVMPMILRPVIDMLIRTGNLPEPQGDWWADWSIAGSLGPKETAEIGNIKMQALKAYLTPGADIVVSIDEFRQNVLGLDPLPEDALQELPALPEPTETIGSPDAESEEG